LPAVQLPEALAIPKGRDTQAVSSLVLEQSLPKECHPARPKRCMVTNLRKPMLRGSRKSSRTAMGTEKARKAENTKLKTGYFCSKSLLEGNFLFLGWLASAKLPVVVLVN